MLKSPKKHEEKTEEEKAWKYKSSQSKEKIHVIGKKGKHKISKKGNNPCDRGAIGISVSSYIQYTPSSRGAPTQVMIILYY